MEADINLRLLTDDPIKLVSFRNALHGELIPRAYVTTSAADV